MPSKRQSFSTVMTLANGWNRVGPIAPGGTFLLTRQSRAADYGNRCFVVVAT